MTDVSTASNIKGTCPPACDMCNAEFSCVRLKAVLNLLEDHKFRDAATREKVAGILAELHDAGWKYPEGQQLCDMAQASEQIQALTWELIKVLEQN